MQIWSKLNYQWPNHVANSNFNEWLNWLFVNSTSNNKENIAITIRVIWNARSKLLHERKLQSVKEVITFIRGYGRDYREVTTTLTHSRPGALIKWDPSPTDWVKVCVDVKFSQTNQKAVLGFLIRNDDGQLMGLGYIMHNLISTAVLAKAMAILHGLQFTKKMGFLRYILECD